MVPSTVEQLTILLLFFLPGIVYQAVLDRLRGPLAAERDSSNRLLRAVAASVVFTSFYAILVGPHLIKLASDKFALSRLAPHSREVGIWGLSLLVLLPSLVAYIEARYDRRNASVAYGTTPTAWDYLFKNRGSCYIRIRLKEDNGWIGGWYGTKSYTSSFPHPPDIFIESQYKISTEGRISERVSGTSGVYVKGSEIEFFELIEPSSSIPDQQ